MTNSQSRLTVSRPAASWHAVAVALFLLGTMCASAQNSGNSASPVTGSVRTAPIPRSSDASPDYVLGPGDQVVLHVQDMDEISDKPLRIDPNGFLDLPLAGRINVSGMTIEQFKQELANKLRRYITSPQISVNLTDDQSRPVSVIGEVNTPGVHQLQGPKRLIEVISMAGGLREDAGSDLILTREVRWGSLPLPGATTDPTGQYSTARLSIPSLIGAKNPTDNILVQPNDVISVPKAEIVYVVGNVKRSGGYPLTSHEQAMSLVQAVSLAQGLDRDAAPRKARIMRPVAGPAGQTGKVDEIPVDIQKIFDGKAPDVQLHANDVLFVPNSSVKSTGRRAAEAALQVATGVAIYAR